jgi:gas vesicle protein GvpL/GvpF
MGMLYVYAITDSAPGPHGIGLHGASLRSVRVGGISAIASEHEHAPQSGVEELWRHEEVVERLTERSAVLPMRFGASTASEEELEAILRARSEEFRTLLDAVRGAVELSVRVAVAAPPAEDVRCSAGGDPATPRTGTEYLRARGRALSGREEAEAQYHEPLDALSRNSRIASARLGSGEFKAAYLVDASRVGAFTRLVAELGQEGEAVVSCTGPWPPYSFVSGAPR